MTDDLWCVCISLYKNVLSLHIGSICYTQKICFIYGRKSVMQLRHLTTNFSWHWQVLFSIPTDFLNTEFEWYWTAWIFSWTKALISAVYTYFLPWAATFLVCGMCLITLYLRIVFLLESFNLKHIFSVNSIPHFPKKQSKPFLIAYINVSWITSDIVSHHHCMICLNPQFYRLESDCLVKQQTNQPANKNT